MFVSCACVQDVQFATYDLQQTSALSSQAAMDELSADRDSVQASSAASINNVGMNLNMLNSKYPGMVDSVFR